MSSIETGIRTPEETNLETGPLHGTPAGEINYEKQDQSLLKRIQTSGKEAMIDLRDGIKDRVSSISRTTDEVIEDISDEVKELNTEKTRSKVLPILGAAALAITAGVLLIKNRASHKSQPTPQKALEKAKDVLHIVDEKIAHTTAKINR